MGLVLTDQEFEETFEDGLIYRNMERPTVQAGRLASFFRNRPACPFCGSKRTCWISATKGARKTRWYRCASCGEKFKRERKG